MRWYRSEDRVCWNSVRIKTNRRVSRFLVREEEEQVKRQRGRMGGLSSQEEDETNYGRCRTDSECLRKKLMFRCKVQGSARVKLGM